MVGNNVNYDVYAIFMSFLAHSGKFSFCTECRISRIVNSEVSRLVIYPPHFICFSFSTLLCLLDNRRLYRGISCLCYLFHVGLDVVERPLPRMEYYTLLTGIHKTVIDCGIYIHGNRTVIHVSEACISSHNGR